MNVWSDIGLYFWRLLPGNPMVVRVVAAAGKRSRHMWARLIYLGVLFAAVLLAQLSVTTATSTSLADLAKSATNTFMTVSLVQLALMSFVAPIFAAGAITQEKDSNTFDILLTTPLSNSQIALGSLFSRLFFVWIMLLSGVPIFCITMIYGGVTTAEVFQSAGLAACTGLVTGATAIMISMLKVGTRRTIFSFFLGVALYLLGVGAIGLWDMTQVAEAPISSKTAGVFVNARMSWLAPFHPFLALFTVTGVLPAPAPERVAHYGGVWSWMLTSPQYAYMLITTLASMAMMLISVVFVRRGQKEGENTLLSRLGAVFARRQQGERRRAPRRVWNNPIAWREASTRGSAAGRSLMRWVYIAGGLVFGLFLLVSFENGWFGLKNTAGVHDVVGMRQWLTVIIWIEMIVILLVVTNTAAGTLTREKESQTIEILLTTPLTSKYIIGGMIQGLVRFVVPLIAVPAGTLLIFLVADLFRGGDWSVVTFESVFLLPVLLIAFCSLAAVIGLHFSLTAKKTVQAVMISTSIVLGVAGLLTMCGFLIGDENATLGAIIMPFTPVPAAKALVDPTGLFDQTPSAAELASVRFIRSLTTTIAALVYLAITYALYNNMVKGFDMIVRRQAA